MQRPRWPGFGNLPRDARDTLFQLAVVAWTLAPHISHLPWWCIGISTLMLLWRAQLALANAPLPKRWAVVGVLGVGLLLTLWTQGTLLGKQAGVTLLVLLLALKTLELRARRDAMVVFFLGFFVVLTNFLYSQSLLTALAMLGSVAGLLTALVLAHMPVGRPALRQAGAIAARAALLGAPIMVALFLLFPRIGPLWGVPQDGPGRTGLSDTLTLGGVASVANDDSIALRLRFKDVRPAPGSMYFRGPVLAGFDGREWTRQGSTPKHWPRAATELRLRGQPVRYEMTLEPSRMTVLPLLETTPAGPDTTPEIDGHTPHLQSDLQWAVDQPVSERLRFEAVAWPAFSHGPLALTLDLREFTQLPSGFNPRTLAWAHALRERPGLAQADTPALVEAVLAHIRDGGYSYTLEPGGYGRDAIDEFWLGRKLGFCEHYAASVVVILRALGVPARIVTGYQGTDVEPVDGYLVVRQRNAHAWAEYWQAGRGWVRLDPTAAVAPDRIFRGRSLAPSSNLVANALGRVNPELLGQLRLALEAANNRWNQWVMNYSRVQQFKLLESLGLEAPNWADLAYVLIGLMLLGLAASGGWVLWDRQRQDPWQRLHRRVQQRLAALKVQVHAHEAPRTRAQRVRASLGAAGEAVATELEALDRLRYAATAVRRPGAQWWKRFDSAASTALRQAPGAG